jgi:hypothetical protein
MLALLAACPGDSTGPSENSGAFTFNFAGSAVGTGSFSVSGVMPASAAQLNNADAAAGAQNSSQASFDVLGVNALGGNQYDVAVLQTGRLTVGSTDIDVQNCNPQTEPCAEFAYFTNGNFTAHTFDQACVLASGTVTVTEVTTTRVHGTFAGSGVCSDQNQTITTITTTSGTFNVPLVAEIPASPFTQ